MGKLGLKHICNSLGDILEVFSYFNIVPAVFPLIIFGIGEWVYSAYFVGQGVLMYAVGWLLKKAAGLKGEEQIRFHYSLIAIFLAWVLIPLFSCITYYMGGLSPVDAYFESVSAWTTTGLTVYEHVGDLPHQILFWRSFEQWLGGLGIVAFIFFIIGKGENLVAFSKTEGREELLKPTLKGSLKEIVKIYVIYTFIGTALLAFTGLDFFNSINIIMTALATGGFIPTEQFILNGVQSAVLILFMLIGATSFLFHHKVFEGKLGIVKVYSPLAWVLVLALIVSGMGIASGAAGIEDSIFHSVSAITNTGFSKMPLNEGIGMYFYGLIVLMLIGGTLGSTAGAIKVDRLIVLAKGIILKVRKSINPPEAVVIERFMNQTIKDEHVSHAALILILHLLLFAVGGLVVNLYAGDLPASLFEVASALGNVGLSAGIVNHALPEAFKLFFIFLMIVGRLEVLTFFVFIGSILKLVTKG